MAHSYRILSTPEELERYIAPIMRSLGSDIPQAGHGVAYTEFDEQGEVVAFQILQTLTVAEGMWARDGSAHLLTLNRMLLRDVKAEIEKQGLVGSGRCLFTMTRGDEQGLRIGRCAKALGYEETDWKVYRRRF